MPATEPRLLFITSTRLGDAVLTTGYLDAIVHTLPGVRTTVVCGPVPAPLFQHVPSVERVVALRKRSYHRHWIELWRDLRHTRWTSIVDLRGSVVTYLLRAGRRVVRTHGHDLSVHVIDELAKLLDMAPQKPRLWLGDDDLSVPRDHPIVALGATANWPAKRWPQERFAALATQLVDQGIVPQDATFAVLGAPDERPLTRDLVAALGPRALDLVGRTDARQAALLLRRSMLFVGVDSGLSHIAAAAGTPTVTLFGPGHPSRYRPIGETVRVLTTGLTYDELTGANFDHRRAATSLLERISVEQVLDATRAMLTT